VTRLHEKNTIFVNGLDRAAMSENSITSITISFTDPDLDLEEQEEEVQKLLSQMKKLDEVEEVDRVLDPNPPVGNKALGGFLVGMLTVEVSSANVKKLLGFLSERLSGKPIKIAVKTPDGREISVEASSQAEFAFAMQKAQEFLQIK